MDIRGGFFGIVTLALFGAMIGDVLAHPQGTQTALNGLSGILKSSYKAAAGQAQ